MIPKDINELAQLVELLQRTAVLYYQSGNFILNIGVKNYSPTETQPTGQADSPEYDVYEDPDLYGGSVPTSLKRKPNGRPSENTDE